MHGLLSGPASMETLKGFIEAAHPGTEVLNVDAYNDLVSLTLKTVQLQQKVSIIYCIPLHSSHADK